ncbi:MAG: sugar phosphate isomerase/epimerase family protein [Planctomycetota bacterium]
MDRRRFLLSSGAAAAAPLVFGAPLPEGARAPRLKKAVKLDMVQGGDLRARFARLAKLGFDGVEASRPGPEPVEDLLAASREAGVPIHGVVNSAHWSKPFSHAKESVRAEGRAAMETALRDAKALGADSVLLVPGIVNAGVAYDDCYRRSQAEIRRVLPLAKELGVRILLENVWNNFLLSPMEAARYIDELESPLVGAYFDIGNVVRYGWPEQWIRILGRRIGKLDVKEYSRKKQTEEGIWKGFAVEIGDGDCGWPAVLAALADIGYEGWATAEVAGGDEARLADIKRRMDLVLGR